MREPGGLDGSSPRLFLCANENEMTYASPSTRYLHRSAAFASRALCGLGSTRHHHLLLAGNEAHRENQGTASAAVRGGCSWPAGSVHGLGVCPASPLHYAEGTLGAEFLTRLP